MFIGEYIKELIKLQNMNEVKIQIPDNCELIKDGNMYIVKEKKQKPPRSWEEFCKRYPIQKGEAYIGADSTIGVVNYKCVRNVSVGKNWCTSKEEAEAFRALMQLRQLRKVWVGDWEQPNSNSLTAAIVYSVNKQKVIVDYGNYWALKVLSFPTKKMAEEFLECFKYLCETAKPLL